MADNYLEKQYESYEARKAAWELERKAGKKLGKKLSKIRRVEEEENEEEDDEEA